MMLQMQKERSVSSCSSRVSKRSIQGEIWLEFHTTAAVIQFVANDEVAPAVQPVPPSRERERSPLSQLEPEIVAQVAQGFKNKELAEKMFISKQTRRFDGEGGSGTPVPAYASFRLEDCPTRTRKPGRNTALKRRVK
jgi:Bacterial regulatory proteins, luxR family